MKPPTKCQFSNQSGFTLIEIMIVVVIIGILAAIAIPNYNRFLTNAKTGACLSEAKAYSNNVFYLINDQDDDTRPTAPTPSACVSITDASNWSMDDMGKIIAIAKPPSNARIECDVPNGTPCKIVP
ncbi:MULTISPECIES: prepilin-type N-terminal cleavage/methylation domain-containing protein [Psychrobacter]|uniref:prepilin-type N-terminal cleavage/methylation domain-containing protein n=1 Tax=Psychrobacter TaxID=497 RepID=UPI00146B74E5|nr:MULTISPECIES: prepilin-type N-terminal cleavage/methylation domain-containing protein [Psychrobacter]